MRSSIRLAPAFAVLLLAGCSPAASSAPGAQRSISASNLTVYGAASLKTALERLTVAYEAATPGVTVTVSTDSSAALETKIEQGAPADLFLSADTANPQKLVDGELADGGVVRFAGNRLTIIIPKDNPAAIHKPVDLAKPGVKIIAAGDAVPITKYASQLVANLAEQPGYPTDFVARYAANIASKEDSVAGVVSKVALGEGDAGIVYITDATSSSNVTAIAVPDAANVHATYGAVVIKASKHIGGARAFLTWLAGSVAQSILASLGFLSPS
ncbi:MAG: molybdate ABC transporter substrate-binding protein [Chloroflexota bacterium]|nr:molybdate ABC transporter substrate-binding protein [Chloroflexota bacterium]